ncbi:MAG: hypothetical protein C0497_00960 [Gemmatimonas sp.]|nr:hypothetical protein [Gemmatimonas sp.]
MYEAARLARGELRNQRDELLSDRASVRDQLTEATKEVDTKGLEGRLAVLDARIADVEKQLAVADLQVANRAAIPGVVVEKPSNAPDPEEIVAMAMGFSLVLLFPLSVAYARRIWRRSAAPPALPPEFNDRMSNLERGIEAVAIEVERLGEGQRFVTQLLADADHRRQLQPVPVDSGKSGREL